MIVLDTSVLSELLRPVPVPEVEDILEEDFRDRILSFDRDAARAYALIAAERRAAGRPISQFDCQIAAIAHAAGAVLATRNVRDFDGCGVEVTDPWRGPAGSPKRGRRGG